MQTGESGDNWSEMITMTGAKDAEGESQTTLDAAAETLAVHFQQACGDTFGSQSLGPGTIDGHQALLVFLGCGTVAAAQGRVSETAIIIFIKGASGYYSLQWAERKPVENSRPVFDATLWNARNADLSPIRVCERVEGEEPPYPSCIFKQ